MCYSKLYYATTIHHVLVGRVLASTIDIQIQVVVVSQIYEQQQKEK
jgi:hypothetical protein